MLYYEYMYRDAGGVKAAVYKLNHPHYLCPMYRDETEENF